MSAVHSNDDEQVWWKKKRSRASNGQAAPLIASTNMGPSPLTAPPVVVLSQDEDSMDVDDDDDDLIYSQPKKKRVAMYSPQARKLNSVTPITHFLHINKHTVSSQGSTCGTLPIVPEDAPMTPQKEVRLGGILANEGACFICHQIRLPNLNFEPLAVRQRNSLLNYFSPTKRSTLGTGREQTVWSNARGRIPGSLLEDVTSGSSNSDLLQTCTYCEKRACYSCVRQCELCQQVICNVCSQPDYSSQSERFYCPDCHE